jgi:hypothetical protein
MSLPSPVFVALRALFSGDDAPGEADGRIIEKQGAQESAFVCAC